MRIATFIRVKRIAASVGGLEKMSEGGASASASAAAEEERLSALRDSIARKGNNSYYYAHGPKIDGPVWDGKEEPRLLSVGEASPSSSVKLAQSFESYAWADEKRCVKIYIDYDGAGEVQDEQISLKQTSASSVEFWARDRKLLLSPLHDEIASATYKKKDASFVLTLKKSEEVTWHSLLKK